MASALLTTTRQIRHHSHIIFSIVVIMMLTACTRTPHPPIVDQAGANQLAQAAVASSRSLETMAETEQAALKPKTKVPPPLSDSYGLNSIVSIDWSGPIEPLVVQIARMSGYQFQVIGRKPAIPVLVDVYARNQKIGSILRNAAYQADKRANVVLYPKRRLIELRYVNS